MLHIQAFTNEHFSRILWDSNIGSPNFTEKFEDNKIYVHEPAMEMWL